MSSASERASRGARTGIGYSGTWSLTGTAAAGAGAPTIANALGYNLPGAALVGTANTIPQPPAGWSTNAAHSVVFTIQYSAATAGNAIQLQTLTVEELN